MFMDAIGPKSHVSGTNGTAIPSAVGFASKLNPIGWKRSGVVKGRVPCEISFAAYANVQMIKAGSPEGMTVRVVKPPTHACHITAKARMTYSENATV
jgi:hypothetical protein